MTKVTTFTAVSAGRVELLEREHEHPVGAELAGETLWTLVSPGTELAMADSPEPRYPYPVALGYAAAFRVSEVGPLVTSHTPGDVVMCMGPHASRQCAGESDVIDVPLGLDARISPFARMLNIPMAAIATTTARPGHRAGVIGLGLVGQMAVRALSASGFDVTGADSSADRRHLVPAGVPTSRELPEGSCDLVIECSGREENAVVGARALREGGELVVTGVPWHRRSDTYLYDFLDLVFHKFLVVRSGWEWLVPRQPSTVLHSSNMTALMTQAMSWLSRGSVEVHGLATTIRPDQLAEAYDALRRRSAPTLTFSVRWAG